MKKYKSLILNGKIKQKLLAYIAQKFQQQNLESRLIIANLTVFFVT